MWRWYEGEAGCWWLSVGAGRPPAAPGGGCLHRENKTKAGNTKNPEQDADWRFKSPPPIAPINHLCSRSLQLTRREWAGWAASPPAFLDWWKVRSRDWGGSLPSRPVEKREGISISTRSSCFMSGCLIGSSRHTWICRATNRTTAVLKGRGGDR